MKFGGTYYEEVETEVTVEEGKFEQVDTVEVESGYIKEPVESISIGYGEENYGKFQDERLVTIKGDDTTKNTRIL